jgi:hypothetical protein
MKAVVNLSYIHVVSDAASGGASAMSLTSGSFTVRNAFGEALSAVIDEPSGENVPRDDAFEAGTSASQRGLAPVVILCHGFRNTKESAIVVNLSRALLAASRAVVR